MIPRWWITTLKLCVSITLIARGWLTWRWDSPIRGIVWKEDWWGNIVDDWSEFATTSDPAISQGLMILGLLMIAGSVIPWLPPTLRWSRWLLLPLAGLLAIDSAARWIDTDFELGMMIEHSLQMVAPIALFLAVSYPDRIRTWTGMVMVATAFTFTGHGLYALGFHSVPLGYQTMTIKILSVSRENALLFLKIAGWLDIVAALCLFIPPLRKIALGYIILWGGATALARIVANGTPDPWLFETAVRTSHWVLPLLLAIILIRKPARFNIATAPPASQ